MSKFTVNKNFLNNNFLIIKFKLNILLGGKEANILFFYLKIILKYNNIMTVSSIARKNTFNRKYRSFSTYDKTMF